MKNNFGFPDFFGVNSGYISNEKLHSSLQKRLLNKKCSFVVELLNVLIQEVYRKYDQNCVLKTLNQENLVFSVYFGVILGYSGATLGSTRKVRKSLGIQSA